MKRGVKQRDGENLSDSNIRKVISMLNREEKPITKKEACQYLNITYNTSRLNSIIEGYLEKAAFVKARKAQKRGRPADASEMKEMIEMYLSGRTYSEISSNLFRSVAFVKNNIEKVGVPERVVGEEKYKTNYLPDECVAENFSLGEVVWCAQYHAPCEIREELPDKKYEEKYSSKVYKVWVREAMEEYGKTGGFFAFQPAYDLGKLEHLKTYGINTDNLA